MAKPCLLACCGVNEDELRENKKSDDKEESTMPSILNLDAYIADWFYEDLKKDHKVLNSRFSKRFPKQDKLDITINWDKAERKTVLKEVVKDPKRTETTTVDSSHDESEAEGSNLGDRSDKNKKEKQPRCETFSVMFVNTLDETCKASLKAENTVETCYEVSIHKGILVKDHVQCSFGLEVGESKVMGKIGASFEFTKLLENWKNYKSIQKRTTTTHTDCPVKVKGKSGAQADIVTTYKDVKEEFKMSSTFSGRISADVYKREQGKKKLYLHSNYGVCKVFKELTDTYPELAARIKVKESPDMVVTVESSMTCSISSGITQKVLLQPYVPKDEKQKLIFQDL